MAGLVEVPPAATLTSMSYSGGYASIIRERFQPVVPSDTVADPPDGAVISSLVSGGRDKGRGEGERKARTG